MCSFPVLRYFLGLLCTMGISACEKGINKNDESKKMVNLGSIFFGQKSLKNPKQN